MTLDDIKRTALNHPEPLQIMWDQLDQDPQYTEEFERTLGVVIQNLPILESLYTKLTSGKSVLLPDSDTALKYDEIEQHTMLIAEELVATYEMADLYDRYTKVKNVIQA